MRLRIGGLAVWPLLLAAAMAMAQTPPAGGEQGERLVQQILKHLGLDARSSLATLDHGKVVYSGLRNPNEPPEEVSAVGAMLLIRGVPPAQVVAAFVAPDTFTRAHEVRRRQAVRDSADQAAIFRDLSVGDADGVKHLLTQPARYYNLSVAEAAQAVAAGRQPGDAKARATELMIGILDGRLRQFRAQGLQGAADYLRDDGRRVSPSKELQLAIQQIGFLEPEFPEVMAALRGQPPKAGAARVLRSDFWLEVPFVDIRVLSLASELRLSADDRALATDLHFYASRGYNSMLTVVGVVPYKASSLVFAITHLFTDEVLGYTSTIKRAAARQQAAAQLVRHLEAVRATLPK